MTPMITRRRFVALTAAPIAAYGAAAWADDWPTRSVKILVGFSPGGSADQFARLIAPDLANTFGQQFYIENRPGSSGILAATLTAGDAGIGDFRPVFVRTL